MTGTIKTLTEKGFGFISIPGGKKDLFFHANNLQNVPFKDLVVGDELEFDTEEGDKGPCAVNIVLISE
jgi:CspA family cold shock protein